MSASLGAPVTGYPVQPPSSATVTNGYPCPALYTYAAIRRHYDPYVVPVPAHATAPPRSTFPRSFIVTLLALFLITGTLMLIFLIMLRPRVPAFYVTSLSLSNYSVSASASASASTSITATWLLTLRAVNPNKKIRISYDKIVSSVAYRDQSLATTSLPPFYQGTRDTIDLKVGFTDKDYYVSLGTANGMEGDRTGRGIVSFDVRVRALAKLKAKGWWWTRTRLVSVSCLRIPVKFTGNATGGSGLLGQLSGGRESECGVVI